MKTTDQLKKEHEGIQIMLDVLEYVAKNISKNNTVHPEDVKNIVMFFREFADKCHHTKEEQELFPALEKMGIRKDGGPIGVMLYEHEAGRNYIQGMMQSMDKILEDPFEVDKFVNNAISYIQLLRDHIEKENNILFKMTDMVINREKDNDIFEKFEKIEKEKIGEGTHEKYHQMIDEYRKKYLKKG